VAVVLLFVAIGLCVWVNYLSLKCKTFPDLPLRVAC
jgi:hypothetical protein